MARTAARRRDQHADMDQASVTTGKSQHHIPRFVQRPFGVPRPNGAKPVEIWHFGLDEAPERLAITDLGSEDHFYSGPSPDGQPTLDDAITAMESGLSLALRDARAMPSGNSIDAGQAARIVSHLAMRTAHLRSSVSDGVNLLLDRTAPLFTETDNIAALIGLDAAMPTDLFRERVVQELASTPAIAGLNVPARLLERVAFMVLKENQAQLLDESVDFMDLLLGKLRPSLEEVVRDGHNRALGQRQPPVDSYEALLRELKWSVESAPTAGAILPDCVVLAMDAEGSANTHLFVGRDGLSAIILPMSPQKLLVGRRSGFDLPDDFDYNAEAARLSHSFFLSPRNDAETSRLHPMVGQRLRPVLATSIEEAVDELLPKKSGGYPSDQENLDGGPFTWHATSRLEYELSLVGCGNGDTIARIQEEVTSLVAQVARGIPLEKLEGITISHDYPAALHAVNRGWEGAPTPRTAPPEVGVGVAQMVTVQRAGAARGRIVASSVVSEALISGSAPRVEWASHVLVRLLVRVAVMGLIDETLPGCLWAPPKMTAIDAWLHKSVDGVPVEYVISRMMAGWGDSQAGTLRQILEEAVGQMASVAREARLSCRRQPDIDESLDAILPLVRQVLSVAADLFAHCDATSESVAGASGRLAEVLDEAGLSGWFEFYGEHLRRFDQRLGRWSSFDELLAFNIHVERLLLAVGIVAWEGPEGVLVGGLPDPEPHS